ncbi:MAG: DUF5666 domain-containing protein [Nocardiaceae bacterium]|nr:DUF5666 domain-containing protein [Nocardiaceae bacterium]
MSGREQPGPGAISEPGTGYTSNPYEPYAAPSQNTEQLSTAEYQPPQWGYTSAPVTPPYGEELPLEATQAPPPPPAQPEEPQPPGPRGSMWPWIVAAIAVLALAIFGSAGAYLASVSSDLNNDAKFDTTIVSAPVPKSTAPAKPTFVPRFVAFSGTIQSNDGTTLVIAPKDGSAAVTVVTNAQTQVLLGGGQGVSAFKAGDGVFVQGSTQQDGKVMARMIIGSLFGN